MFMAVVLLVRCALLATWQVEGRSLLALLAHILSCPSHTRMLSAARPHSFLLRVLPDLDTQTVEEVYPAQWVESSPGFFTYTYIIISLSSQLVYLAIDGSNIEQVTISSITDAPNVLDTLTLPSGMAVGQQISLQLNSSATDFASLAGNSTGWRVQLLRPDNSTAELGLMADWTVVPGPVYKWNMTVPGSYFTQVG
jgi:hypothetical protein